PPYPDPAEGQIRLDTVDGVIAVVEHRRRQHGVRARAKRLRHVRALSDPARGDHRHSHGACHGLQELHVGTETRAIAIPAREQDFPRTQTRALPRPRHGIGSPGLTAAERERFPPTFSPRAARIDGEYDALASELGRQLGKECGTLHRGGLYAHLVGTRRARPARIVHTPDAAAAGEAQATGPAHALNRL